MTFLVPSVKMREYYVETGHDLFFCCSLLHFLLYVIYGVQMVWLNATRRPVAVNENYDLEVNLGCNVA